MYILDYLHKKYRFAGFQNSDVIIGRRDRAIFQNDLVAKYAINNKMTLNLTARYYWSYSDVKEYYTPKTTEN
jgi:hypothetical protein